MTNNTDEEHLDKLTNTQSENVADELLAEKPDLLLSFNEKPKYCLFCLVVPT